jgi:hypothetical protein
MIKDPTYCPAHDPNHSTKCALKEAGFDIETPRTLFEISLSRYRSPWDNCPVELVPGE